MWPFTQALPDQRANRIAQVCKDDVFYRQFVGSWAKAISKTFRPQHDSTQYASKLGGLLAEDSYRLLSRNPTTRIEKWVTDPLKSVERDGQPSRTSEDEAHPKAVHCPTDLWSTQGP